MTTQRIENTPANAPTDYCIKTAIGMLVNIVETACEHESDLELMRLVNFMDLYRTYLAHAQGDSVSENAGISGATRNTLQDGTLENTACPNFEHFISDSRLLQFAAEAASRECGVAVSVPPPLKLSANGNF